MAKSRSTSTKTCPCLFWIILAVSNVCFFCAARFHKNLRKLPEDDNFIQGDEYNIKGTDGISRTGSLFQPEVEPTVPLSITVTTIMGQATPLDVQSTDTIGAVKAMIEEKDGVPVTRQQLVFDDTPQEDGAMLGAVGVGDGATIHLIMKADEPEPEPISEGVPA